MSTYGINETLWMPYDGSPDPLAGYRPLGILPALGVPHDEMFSCGIFRIVACGAAIEQSDGTEVLSELAQRYGHRREGPGEETALLYLKEGADDLVLIAWPLLVFAFVSWGLRAMPAARGYDITSPSGLFMPAVTVLGRPARWINYFTGTESGMGRVQQFPLRWPVDRAQHLPDAVADARVLLALSRLEDVAREEPALTTLRTISCAADLYNGAAERHTLKVSGVSNATRCFVMLLSAFETVHRATPSASDEKNLWQEIRAALASDLVTRDGSLTAAVLSRRSIDHGVVKEGCKASVIEFVLERLAWIRNRLAHGRLVDSDGLQLPVAIGSGTVESASRQILGILIGQRLLEVVGAPSGLGLRGGLGGYGAPDFRLIRAAERSAVILDDCLSTFLRAPATSGP